MPRPLAEILADYKKRIPSLWDTTDVDVGDLKVKPIPRSDEAADIEPLPANEVNYAQPQPLKRYSDPAKQRIYERMVRRDI